MAFGDWLSGLFGGGGGGGMATSPEQALSGVGFGTPPPAMTTDTGGGGFWSSLGSGLSSIGDIAKAAVPIAQLGTTGMGIWGGIESMNRGKEQMGVLKKEQQRQQQMAQPAAAAGGALTQAGQSALLGGNLPPALEAQVQDWKNQAKMRYMQQLASQGQTDSSAAIQLDAWLETQAQKLRGELAGNLYGQGLAGVQTAMGPSGAVSTTAMGMAEGTTGSLEAANKALAQLLGSA